MRIEHGYHLFFYFLRDVKSTQTDGHGDSNTDPAQRAESVKILVLGCMGCMLQLFKEIYIKTEKFALAKGCQQKYKCKLFPNWR